MTSKENETPNSETFAGIPYCYLQPEYQYHHLCLNKISESLNLPFENIVISNFDCGNIIL